MAEPEPFGTAGFTTKRVFAAARERVWRDWTEPLGDGRTEMHFEQRGHQRPDGYDRAQRGWGAFFARIDARLAGAP